MCKVMEVKRSGFYHYQKSFTERYSDVESELVEQTSRVAKSSGHTYGTRCRKEEFLSGIGKNISPQPTAIMGIMFLRINLI